MGDPKLLSFISGDIYFHNSSLVVDSFLNMVWVSLSLKEYHALLS